MPVKIARSTPRPSFGLRELLVASHISRLASRDAAKSLLSTLVSESSGECRFKSARGEDCARKNRQFEPKNATPGLVLLSQKVATNDEENHLFGKIHTSAMGGWNGSAKIE